MHEIDLDVPLILPWPPSVNSCWRLVGTRVLLSKKYRSYKRIIKSYALFWKRKPLEGRLSIEIKVYPPDRRKRDLDNLIKGTLDSLQYARLFLDDSQIDKLSIERKELKKGGELHIVIKEI